MIEERFGVCGKVEDTAADLGGALLVLLMLSPLLLLSLLQARRPSRRRRSSLVVVVIDGELDVCFFSVLIRFD